MGRRLKLLWGLILLSLLYIATPKSVQAAVTIDNDGSARDVPYGDSKLPKSYPDLDYYDCYLPYNTTLEEIGGYSNGVKWCKNDAYNYDLEHTYPNWLNRCFTTRCMYEGNYTAFKTLRGMMGNPQFSMENENSMLNIATDGNGNRYYITAVQDFFWNFGGLTVNGNSSFPTSCEVGQIFDMILTDGTVIHFVVGDSNATEHTNGGPEGTQDGVTYSYADMVLNQYKNLYSCINGNCIELWGKKGCTTEFKEKYNLYEKDEKADGSQIAYYRMYNARISDNPTRDSGVGTEVSYNLGEVSISSSGSSASSTKSSLSSLVSEWELEGMPPKSTLKDKQRTLMLPSKKNLSTKESYSVAQIKENIILSKQATAFDRARIILAFMGLVIVSYAILLFLCMIFDRVNVFIEGSLVSFFTFGKLHYSPYEEDVTNRKGMSNTKKLMISIVVVLIVGLFVLSGSILPIMGDVIYWFSQKFLY